ncbi:hypothetical protein AMTR_s00088p00026360 [Amborella trichopoda]|uniref:Uncharacterized protein n=1 Tax=Amborella trichopoda TaxID=13333 RepID=W1NW41_AMBTC|nr:hypothetical protein AMTR_s00088p00026360 [Amborella trichopoda]
MDTVSTDSESSPSPSITPTPDNTHAFASSEDSNAKENPSKLSASALSSWARCLRTMQPVLGDESQSSNHGKLTISRFTSGFGLRTSPKAFPADEGSEGTSATTLTMTQSGVFGELLNSMMCFIPLEREHGSMFAKLLKERESIALSFFLAHEREHRETREKQGGARRE